ncbi:MAG: hypothetical protein A2Z25_11595 [Planctomycetes bacterium RBG_16_55_9]|nr:MAG: hypothetical protein A2Z25_11595 [Planctomycetes bacterium RBG_16_55_9]
METVPNASSEEELLKLREEGKISEAEYQDLRSAMSKRATAPEGPPERQHSDTVARHKRGKVALIVMLAGLLLPVLGYGMVAMSAGPNEGAAIAPWFFLGVALQLVGFVLGVSSWPDVYGKTTVLTISAIAALAVVLLALV